MSDSPQALNFSIAEDTGELRACFDPAAGMAPPDAEAVRQRLAADGCGDYFLDDKALAEFVRGCADAGQPVEKAIGQRRDGEFKLTLADDLMTAHLTLIPPCGGKPAGPAVIDALREQKVVYGIQHAALDAALAAGHCESLLIAQGEPPQEGVATGFEPLFGEPGDAAAALDENAVIKLTDISRLLLVHPNDPLMRRHPPVPGKNGTNIRNELVMPRALGDEAFAANLDGAALDAQDPNLLVATLAGQPVMVPKGVKVNPVISVENVDLETGSISFEGTLNVAGDIRTGMRVNVTGDVLVKGTIESAEIIAGGNVIVKGGVIGRSEARSGVGATHSLPANTARILCAGSVHVHFAENAHIEAGDSIVIDREASHCELMARKSITIGKLGARGGHLVGGTARATENIECTVLGSEAGAKTRVQVGSDPYLDEVIRGKKHLLQTKAADLERVLLLQQYLQQNPQRDKDGVGAKAENTRLQLLADIETLNNELMELGSKQETVERARVVVRKALYFGTEIQIGAHLLEVEDDMGAATARLQDEEIVFDH